MRGIGTDVAVPEATDLVPYKRIEYVIARTVLQVLLSEFHYVTVE